MAGDPRGGPRHRHQPSGKRRTPSPGSSSSRQTSSAHDQNAQPRSDDEHGTAHRASGRTTIHGPVGREVSAHHEAETAEAIRTGQAQASPLTLALVQLDTHLRVQQKLDPREDKQHRHISRVDAQQGQSDGHKRKDYRPNHARPFGRRHGPSPFTSGLRSTGTLIGPDRPRPVERLFGSRCSSPTVRRVIFGSRMRYPALTCFGYTVAS